LVFTPRDPDREERWEQLTDTVGRFAIEWLPLGTYDLHVEALAFLEFTRPVTFSEAGTADVRVEMVPDALELEPIVVTATRPAWLADVGFYERRARGLGYSLAREEIEARNPYLVSSTAFPVPTSSRSGRGEPRLSCCCADVASRRWFWMAPRSRGPSRWTRSPRWPSWRR
jgi:hypothetical protein